jgi:gamma-glutamyltranspeptidase/glutathione hydrolase
VLWYDAAADTVWALDGRETAPAAATRDMYLTRDGIAEPALSTSGALAVAVPGLVRGLGAVHERGGRLPWPAVLEAAIVLARDGFPVSPLLHERIAAHRGRLDPAARRVFLPEGEVPRPGTILYQTDLAGTLEAIARDGPDAFYVGPIADALGILTVADLAAYRPVWRRAIHGRYRGREIWSMPPPSSGGVHLIEMLNILEGFDLAAAGYGSAAAWHPMIEAMKFAFADRSYYLGDPDFVAVPVARLTSRAYADSLRALIRPDAALPAAAIGGGTSVPPEGRDTTHLSVVDADGNAVAATLTINLGFGSGLLAAGTGVLLNDEMDDFAAAPGQPNAFGLLGGEANSIAGGKRPLSSMTPTIVVAGGRVVLVSGSPGGSRIITTTLQTLIHVIDFGMDAQSAVGAPRIHHQWYPPEVYYEAYGMSPDTRALLTARGHVLEQHQPLGNAQLIVVDPATTVRYGASDPRGAGAAAGY